jgi:hypothetical protein
MLCRLAETHLSIIWSSSWLLVGAIIGFILLARRESADTLDRGIAISLLAQVILILSFMGLCQRYTAEIFPFLIFCFVIFLRKGGVVLVRTRYAMLGLVALCTITNTLATAFLAGTRHKSSCRNPHILEARTEHKLIVRFSRQHDSFDSALNQSQEQNRARDWG